MNRDEIVNENNHRMNMTELVQPTNPSTILAIRWSRNRQTVNVIAQN